MIGIAIAFLIFCSVDRKPREILYVTFDHIEMQYSVSVTRAAFLLNIYKLQIDNQVLLTNTSDNFVAVIYPIVSCSSVSYNTQMRG